MKWPLLIGMLIVAIAPDAAGGPDGRLERFHHKQIHMGVQVGIVLYAPDAAAAAAASGAAFAEIARLDGIMSDYRPRSELMRLCAEAGGAPVPVSHDLFAVLQRAQDVSARTGGAFDVTAGPYVQLWRRARKTGDPPSEDELARARDRVGWEKLRLDPQARTVQLLVPGMRLDLGGIAKGYALDRALAVLRQHGIARALIEAGGDIVVGEAPPAKTGWRIQVAGAERGRRFVTLWDSAISTSGDTEQYVDIGGTRCSHIVDPRVGLRCGEPILATVVGPDATTTDSLATAACVLGREKSLELLGAIPGVRVYVRPAPHRRARRRSALPDMIPCSSSGLNSDSRVTFRIALSG